MNTPAIFVILAVNVLAFVGLNFDEGQWLDPLVLWPLGQGFQIWQVLSYGFLHAGLLHIVLNMFGLLMFGTPLERAWGALNFVSYYFFCIVCAGLTQLAFSAVTGSAAPTVGASGGIFGLLLAFALRYPEARIFLVFLPVPIPARIFVLLYAAVELGLGVSGTDQGVAHFAHLGGMVGGFIYLQFVGGLSRR